MNAHFDKKSTQTRSTISNTPQTFGYKVIFLSLSAEIFTKNLMLFQATGKEDSRKYPDGIYPTFPMSAVRNLRQIINSMFLSNNDIFKG